VNTTGLNKKALLEANRRLAAELAQRDGRNRPSPWRQHHSLAGKPKRALDHDEAAAAAMGTGNANEYRCDWCGRWHIGRLGANTVPNPERARETAP